MIESGGPEYGEGGSVEHGSGCWKSDLHDDGRPVCVAETEDVALKAYFNVSKEAVVELAMQCKNAAARDVTTIIT